MEKNQVIGAIQIENEEVRIIVVQFYHDRFDIIAKESVACKGINGVTIVDENQVISAISKAADNISLKLQAPLKSVLLIVPGYRFKKERRVVDMLLDKHMVTYDDIKAVYKEAYKTNIGHDYEIINLACSSYKVNSITYPKIPLGEKGEILSCDVDIICGDRLMAYDYVNVVTKAGLEVIDVCQDCFASCKEAAIFENSHNKYTVNLYLEKTHSVYFLINNGRLITGFSNEEGYQSLVKPIMDNFGLPYGSARRLLFRYGVMDQSEGDDRTIAKWKGKDGNDRTITYEQLQKAISPSINKFIENVYNYCSDIISRENMSMVICGAGAGLDGLDRALSKRFNREVSCYCPDKLGVREQQYAALLGMFYYYTDLQIVYGSQKCSVDMDVYREHLLPEELNKDKEITGKLRSFTDKLFAVEED